MQSLLCYYNAVVQEKFCFRLSGASFLSQFASGSFPATLFFALFKTQQPSLFDSQPPHQKHSSRKGKQEVAHSRPTPCDDDIFQHCPPHPQLQTADTPSAHCRSASADKLSISSTTRPPSLKKHTRASSLPLPANATETRRWAGEKAQRAGGEEKRRETGVWCPPVPEEAACQLGKARWKQSHMMAAGETEVLDRTLVSG